MDNPISWLFIMIVVAIFLVWFINKAEDQKKQYRNEAEYYWSKQEW